MICDTCGSGGPGAKQKEYEAAKTKARAYAKENQTNVFLYEDPVQGWQFIEESRAAGYPLRELVSHD